MMVRWEVNLRCQGGTLNLISTNYPDHGHHGRLPLLRKTHMVEPGIEPGTTWLVVRRCDHQATRLVDEADIERLNFGDNKEHNPKTCRYFRFCWPCIWLWFLVNDRTILFYVFISILCMFRATSCSSSGESIVSIRHLVYVTLCRWPFRVQVFDLYTKRSPTQSDIYQTSYWYNWFSWWWARGCSKHAENWNKHIEKNCASSWSFTKKHADIFARMRRVNAL